jgi:hypothetical protein
MKDGRPSVPEQVEALAAESSPSVTATTGPSVPSTEAAAETARPAPVADIALVHGRTEQCELLVLRARRGGLEHGVLRPLRAGQPITGEVVKLSPHEDFPLLCDVETQFDPAATPAVSHKGPARVTSDSYRRNWESIWRSGGKGELN